MPLTSNRDSVARKFWGCFVNWVERWQSQNIEGKLTKEAFTALSYTCRALLDIAEYCLKELGAKYELLGKFQTDALEARFGQYWQLAGGNYKFFAQSLNIKKIRMLSVL